MSSRVLSVTPPPKPCAPREPSQHFTSGFSKTISSTSFSAYHVFRNQMEPGAAFRQNVFYLVGSRSKFAPHRSSERFDHNLSRKRPACLRSSAKASLFFFCAKARSIRLTCSSSNSPVPFFATRTASVDFVNSSRKRPNEPSSPTLATSFSHLLLASSCITSCNAFPSIRVFHIIPCVCDGKCGGTALTDPEHIQRVPDARQVKLEFLLRVLCILRAGPRSWAGPPSCEACSQPDSNRCHLSALSTPCLRAWQRVRLPVAPLRTLNSNCECFISPPASPLCSAFVRSPSTPPNHITVRAEMFSELILPTRKIEFESCK